MNFPYTYRLARPRYKYSDDDKNTHEDKHRGLMRYGRLKPARVVQPHSLFVFNQSDRDHANQLYLALRNGIAQFPGCKQLTGITLERDNVESVTVDVRKDDQLASALSDAIENRLASSRPKPDFAFVINTRQPNPRVHDPYASVKAVLTKHGIPSQYISEELLDSPNTFQYAVSNIALSLLVKLGGIPWSVAFERKLPTLVLGVGAATTKDPSSRTLSRLIGYSVCVLSNGLYLDTSFFSPAETYKQFLDYLAQGLKQALQKMLSEEKQVGRVTIHVSRFERHETIEVIRQVLVEYERSQGIVVPFELVRVTTDSDFSVSDLSHSGYVSEEGTVVALEANHSLLVAEGRREKAVWRGRKPVTLELHQEYRSSASLDLRDTLEDAFHLSSVNWRGFNVTTQPISMQYARLLALQVSKMSSVQPDICALVQKQKNFRGVPWFI